MNQLNKSMNFQIYTKKRNEKFDKQFKSLLFDERSSLVEFLLDKMPKKWGKLKGRDEEEEIHHRGYDEALNEVTALLESYLLWANSTAEE